MATRVFFATNRAFQAGLFGAVADKAVRTLRLGQARVAAAAGDGVTRVIESRSCDGLDDFAAPGGSCGGVLDGFLRAAEEEGAVPFLTVHGFDFTFDDAILRTAELAEMFAEANPRLRALPLLFTWPSGGADYLTERRSAKASGPALGRLLAELASRGMARRRGVLLAHSSGAWALQHAVQAVPEFFKDGRVPRIFRDAVLAAADVDADALSDPGALKPLASMAERVTALVLPGDHVLNGLSLSINGAERLGSHGPPLDLPMPPNARVLDMNYLVDLSGKAPPGGTDWNHLGHQYYRTETKVRDALTGLLLADSHPPDQSWRLGVRDRTVHASERAAAFYWYAGAPPPRKGEVPTTQEA